MNEYNKFYDACKEGNLENAQQILLLNPDIDVSADNECAFRSACGNGHLHVAQWLLQIKPTINVSFNDEYAFNIGLWKWAFACCSMVAFN